MKLEIKSNLIEGREYQVNGIKLKVKFANGELYAFDEYEKDKGWYEANIEYFKQFEIELIPNIPDENTPQGTMVKVRDSDCHKWATGKFLCINALDEHQRYVIWADKGCTMDYRYCEIIEED